MKLIIGLGNPGSKYAQTKHNIGFITLDEIAYQKGWAFNRSNFESVYAEGTVGTEKVVLIKPQTYMNDSGRSVRQWLDYYNCTEEDIVVVYDDMDLPVGKVRLRQKGGAGGHNGIKSLIDHLGTKQFNRLRVGVGRPYENQSVVSHVLSPFHKSVHEDVLFSVKKASDAALYWVEGHTFADTMTNFN
ncbi:aminoacyl-tRNA hydrolase [Alkalibacterium olivapovliticus]|uniref:Peptidyl-tRNA hydrolase n=1 Tax=Alkalibacterium olivapovliticus TaxID=99907 RepID=A0A2T0WAJ9_9LACT|nr:aminoacyl-tRNA hydrolase [Alkalibacterium olivapovliticus]PRY83733.1 PTH1 family peptidyl-tRNA hydrolase [Alkalibacterium olivapovliticus]